MQPATSLESTDELFALTDDQILGIQPEDEPAIPEPEPSDPKQQTVEARSNTNPQDSPPTWLADRMNDPWHGEAARELWESTQKAQQEATCYREIFATPADARALKDLYPGGVAEAKSAADRARQLAEIDTAYFSSPQKSPSETNAARAQLAQRLMDQDPAAFREMVMAGMELMERSKNTNQNATTPPARNPNSQGPQENATLKLDEHQSRSYAEFEKSANADLERSVGATIYRTIEQALPNLRHFAADQSSAPLTERLTASVKEEIDAALKSDPQLGEQVSKLLSARNFNNHTRAQVVRLIDARAQQLVPGAVRRVVTSWTQTTLSSRQTPTQPQENNPPRSLAPQPQKSPIPEKQSPQGEKQSQTQKSSPTTRDRRPNYNKLTDEQILNL